MAVRGKRRQAILVSPGAVDGYPPVQYQARLLAEAGYSVTLVTTPLGSKDTVTAFAHRGVVVDCVAGWHAFGSRTARMWQFCKALFAARTNLSSDAIEIAYDPIGLFYSDIVPFRPHRRVAHFHELLQYPTKFLERRLERSICNYDVVVVADSVRAEVTQTVLSLGRPPLVIENYPMRGNGSLPMRGRGDRFEVVYCGALGLNQRLDCVIRSIPAWPRKADLVLIGNDATPISSGLRSLAADVGVTERVHFLGWMHIDAAERRITQADLGIALFDSGFEQWRTALGASNKRYQYMKAGLPQIGDMNPGVRDLLEGNNIGSCVSSHDPYEIGALVSKYVQDPQRTSNEGARAHCLHVENYNYERVFQRLLAIIEVW